MKSHYRVVVIGGGVVGASVRCHLAQEGCGAAQRPVTSETDATDADADGREAMRE